MDDDSDRSSEATQFEENSTAEDTMHHDNAEDSEDDDDQRDATPLQYSPMSPDENTSTSQPLTLVVSDLSEVPVKYEMQRDELEHLKNQLQGSHQEALATVIANARAYSKIQISSLQCSNSQEQNRSHTVNNADVAELKHKDTVPKSLSDLQNVKVPIDCYNWRKYGQKQVKSPQGSRSYYKCTYSECDAKKTESCDENNSVTKIVYKGHHIHDPLVSNGGKIFSSPKSLKGKSISRTGLKPQQKQRLKKSRVVDNGSVMKHPKKPNCIVHASDDMEISADGYRWRKYGQKMVKGNPHPRNYYKCTCAGCGVTKHIEKAVDGSSNIIITYKGVHDHDKPVPKKRRGGGGDGVGGGHSSSSSHPNNLLTTIEASNRSNESTPTLVSVGFEIKRC